MRRIQQERDLFPVGSGAWLRSLKWLFSRPPFLRCASLDWLLSPIHLARIKVLSKQKAAGFGLRMPCSVSVSLYKHTTCFSHCAAAISFSFCTKGVLGWELGTLALFQASVHMSFFFKPLFQAACCCPCGFFPSHIFGTAKHLATSHQSPPLCPPFQCQSWRQALFQAL